MRSKSSVSRRDLLKLASLLPLGLAAKPLKQTLLSKGEDAPPNVIVLVFDAWSAYHLQFLGYPRRTMPNLERFAEKATVFHRHYTAGTFTCPGTASLLTGLHPWSHRAFALGGAGVIDAQASHQLFSVFADTHHTLGFAHNKFADTFLCQFAPYLDTHIPTGAFNLERRLFYNLPLLKRCQRRIYQLRAGHLSG